MIRKLIQYIVLPEVPENFEKNYIRVMNQVAFWFFALHVPIFMTIAYFNQTGALLAGCLSLLTLMGPMLAMKTFRSQRSIAIVMGITSMFMGGLLVHFGQGPIQIEMHFYFFVLLALLAVFADPMVVIAAALTAAIHHSVIWLALPSSVFNYDAPFWVVGVHALFVVLESVAACFIARTFFDNINGLEKKVEERTSALASRNRDMRTMLDAVQQGFFTIDRELKISEERSGAVDRAFGSPSGMTLPEFLAQFDAPFAEWTEFGLEDVFAEIMPVEVTIDQLPERFVANESTYSIEYTPVYEDNELISLAVVISDVSAAVEKEKLESTQREMMAMVHRLAEDKAGFLEFFTEATSLVNTLNEIPDQEIGLLKRRIHTLKGITAIYGLERVAKLCHEIEEHMEQTDAYPEQAHWDALIATWSSVQANFEKLAGHETVGIELSKDEYQQLLFDLLESKSRDELAIHLARFSLEPTERRLSRLGEQAKSLGQRLGKGDITIKKEGGILRADPHHWAEFWSAFIHVVRNSVDHGLESPELRKELGKPEFGSVHFKTEIDGKNFIISVRDDGRGIDWDKIKSVCQERGLPHETRQDLVDAIFSDGLSTRDSVTETSGRGVGLAAVKQCTEELLGTISVESETGVGTEFRFVFPQHMLAPDMFELLENHNVVVDESRVKQLCSARKPTQNHHEIETCEQAS